MSQDLALEAMDKMEAWSETTPCWGNLKEAIMNSVPIRTLLKEAIPETSKLV